MPSWHDGSCACKSFVAYGPVLQQGPCRGHFRLQSTSWKNVSERPSTRSLLCTGCLARAAPSKFADHKSTLCRSLQRTLDLAETIMKNLRLEGVLDGLGRNVKAAFEPEFPGQSTAQLEAKEMQNIVAFWRLFLMQVFLQSLCSDCKSPHDPVRKCCAFRIKSWSCRTGRKTLKRNLPGPRDAA